LDDLGLASVRWVVVNGHGLCYGLNLWWIAIIYIAVGHFYWHGIIIIVMYIGRLPHTSIKPVSECVRMDGLASVSSSSIVGGGG